MHKKIIAVIGTADATPSQYDVAYEIGAGIAQRGFVLLSGGRTGVMEASCRGAAEAGGVVVGLLPGASAAGANQWVAIPLATGLSNARNAVIAQAADLLLAVGGGPGTLSEIGLGLKAGKPVIGVGSFKVEGLIACRDATTALAQMDELNRDTP